MSEVSLTCLCAAERVAVRATAFDISNGSSRRLPFSFVLHRGQVSRQHPAAASAAKRGARAIADFSRDGRAWPILILPNLASGRRDLNLLPTNLQVAYAICRTPATVPGYPSRSRARPGRCTVARGACNRQLGCGSKLALSGSRPVRSLCTLCTPVTYPQPCTSGVPPGQWSTRRTSHAAPKTCPAACGKSPASMPAQASQADPHPGGGIQG